MKLANARMEASSDSSSFVFVTVISLPRGGAGISLTLEQSPDSSQVLLHRLCDTNLEVVITAKLNCFLFPQTSHSWTLSSWSLFSSFLWVLPLHQAWCQVWGQQGPSLYVEQHCVACTFCGVLTIGRLQLTALWGCNYNFIHAKLSMHIISDSLLSWVLEMLWQRDQDPEHLNSHLENIYFTVGTNTQD